MSNVYVSSLKKKRKKSSRSLRTESGAKLAMDCYVAVYYASGRERKREREKERKRRRENCKISSEYDRLNAITFSAIDLA